MPPDPRNTTANGTNSTANETMNGTAGGGGGGGVFPDGWTLLEGALTGLLQSFTSGVASAVDAFNYHLLTLPAPGDPMSPATWSALDDPYWIAVATVYGMMAAFVLPLVWGVGWFNVGHTRGVSRRERLKDVGKALFLIIGGWPLLAFWLHFWNQAALAFAPSGGEFLATPGNATKLGVGVALGISLLAIKAVVVLVGLAIHLMFVVLTFVFVALWPLSIGLYLSDVVVADTIGTAGVSGTLLLSPLQFAKAVLLRLIFEFPLALNEPETLTTFLLIIVGVLLAFVGIPYYGLKRLLPRSVVATGGRLSNQRDRMSGLQDRAPSGQDLRARVESVSSNATSRLGSGRSSGSSLQSRTRDVSTDGGQSTSRLSQRGEDTRTRTRTVKQRLDDNR